MSENTREEIHNDQKFVAELLREQGLTIKDLRERKTLEVVGESANSAVEYLAVTEKGEEISFFAKFFGDINTGDARNKVLNEKKATEKLNHLIPGISYEVFAYSLDKPVILTETIQDSVTFDDYFRGIPDERDAMLIANGLDLLAFTHKNGIIHGDASARNFSWSTTRQFEENEFGGLVIIDFEKALFEEDLNPEEFEDLQIKDVVKFLYSIFPVVKKEAERPAWKKELKNYYEAQNAVIMVTLGKHYSNNVVERVANELNRHIEAVANWK